MNAHQMNKSELQALILDCIYRDEGDDLERAQAAFAGYTVEQMQEQFGASGQTRQQILDAYSQDRHNHRAAVEYVERLFEESDE